MSSVLAPVLHESLRASAASLSNRPGVYVFWGDDGDRLPLYVGKSIQLRTRVLDHFRSPGEAGMMQRARRVEIHPTTGEIGALLLESRLVKKLHPLYNKRLRRQRSFCSWRQVGHALELVHSTDAAFTHSPDLYGLFSSRRAAQETLAELADVHQLCLATLGIEKLPPGKPCFRHAIGRCAGACCAQESLEQHMERTLAALQAYRFRAWPFEGPICLSESWGNETEHHVLNNWCYLGSASSMRAARRLAKPAAGFDLDDYKILVRPLLLGKLNITPL